MTNLGSADLGVDSGLPGDQWQSGRDVDESLEHLTTLAAAVGLDHDDHSFPHSMPGLGRPASLSMSIAAALPTSGAAP
jgi:hypothetical protein